MMYKVLYNFQLYSLQKQSILMYLGSDHIGYKYKQRYISSTRLTFNQLEQAIQYTYRLCKANRDGTPNESVPSKEYGVQWRGGRPGPPFL